jgi:leader peptidase (prepilin peptidase) / N-methyltransferase
MILLDFFQYFPMAFCCFMGVIGLLFGSFLNVIIYRLPKVLMEVESKESEFQAAPNDAELRTTGNSLEINEIQGETFGTSRNSFEMNEIQSETFGTCETHSLWHSLLTSRSRCPHCDHSINARDNCPILSFCILKGRCRHCRESISFRYPLVELLTCVLSFFIAFRFGVSLTTMAALILTWALIALAFIDFDTLLLPDHITIPFIWLGLLLSLFPIFQKSQDAVLGAISGYLFLFTLYWIFKWISGKEGMGFGDFKLLSMLGAWLGWQTLPLIIFISSFCGVLVGTFLIFFKKQNKNVPIPFGPFLALGGFFALMLGNDLESFYFWALRI